MGVHITRPRPLYATIVHSFYGGVNDQPIKRLGDYEHPNDQMTEYTPREASRLLDVPASTIRRWAKRFSHRLSSGAQRRKRIYDQNDLDTFARIRDLSAQNHTLDEIDGMLGDIVYQTNDHQRSLSLPGVLREINGITGRVDEHDQELKQLRQRLQKIEEDMDKPWWKRLFGG